MRRFISAAAALACIAAAASAGAMTHDEYRAQRLRIQDQYATAKDRCFVLRPHDRDVCEAQAKADYDIGRYDLRARLRPGSDSAAQAARAKANAQLSLAQARCGDLHGGARRICMDEAKSRWTTALREQTLANR